MNFQDQKLSSFPAKTFTQVNIYDENGKILTECFRQESTKEGWCGTCQVGINFSSYSPNNFLVLKLLDECETRKTWILWSK